MVRALLSPFCAAHFLPTTTIVWRNRADRRLGRKESRLSDALARLNNVSLFSIALQHGRHHFHSLMDTATKYPTAHLLAIWPTWCGNLGTPLRWASPYLLLCPGYSMYPKAWCSACSVIIVITKVPAVGENPPVRPSESTHRGRLIITGVGTPWYL